MLHKQLSKKEKSLIYQAFRFLNSIDSYLQSLGFTKCEADWNLYHIQVKGKTLISVLYIDNLFLTRPKELIVHCK